MTKAIKASENGLEPHYKVRVVLPGAILHLASWTLQVTAGTRVPAGHAAAIPDWSTFGLRADWIDEAEYGDTIVHIDWDAVVAVSYRFSP